MRIICRDKMVTKGVCGPCEEVIVNFEAMSEQLLSVISSEENWDQTDLNRLMRSQDWVEGDFNICLSILIRKNKIVFMSD